MLFKQSEMVLEHLILVTLTFDPKINRVPLLPRVGIMYSKLPVDDLITEEETLTFSNRPTARSSN